MKTTKGDILLELDNLKAPLSTKNFLNYVKSGHYDETIFHRVMSGFMVQGGGYTVDIEWEAGKLTKASIQATADGDCPVRYGGKQIMVKLKKGESREIGIKDFD